MARVRVLLHGCQRAWATVETANFICITNVTYNEYVIFVTCHGAVRSLPRPCTHWQTWPTRCFPPLPPSPRAPSSSQTASNCCVSWSSLPRVSRRAGTSVGGHQASQTEAHQTPPLRWAATPPDIDLCTRMQLRDGAQVGAASAETRCVPCNVAGYMRDKFVFSLISAVGIFCLGAGVSVWHGCAGLMSAEPVEHLAWSAAGAARPPSPRTPPSRRSGPPS